MRWSEAKWRSISELAEMVGAVSMSKMTGADIRKALVEGDDYLARRQLVPPPYLSPDECRTCGALRASEKCQGLLTGRLYEKYKHVDRDANARADKRGKL